LDVYNSTAQLVAQFSSSNAISTRIKFSDANTGAENVNVGAIGTRLALWTNNTERLSILSGGNVGIGTTSPTTKFEVNRNTANTLGIADGAIQISGDLSPIAFVGQSNLNPGLNRWGFKLREVSDGDFSIYSYTDSLTRLLINSSGNVGIGSTSPANRLDVLGTVSASAFLGSVTNATSASFATSASTTVLNAAFAAACRPSLRSPTSSGRFDQTICAGSTSMLISCVVIISRFSRLLFWDASPIYPRSMPTSFKAY
jgi:hypothetical protein